MTLFTLILTTLVSIIHCKTVSILYCVQPHNTCNKRGSFDLGSGAFTAETAFDAAFLQDAAVITVRAEGVAALAQNLGPKEDLRLWLSSSGEISGLSLHLLPHTATSKFALMRPEVVTAPAVLPPKAPKAEQPKAEGEQQEEEPSFLKKYWWAILIIYAGAQAIAASVEEQPKTN